MIAIDMGNSPSYIVVTVWISCKKCGVFLGSIVNGSVAKGEDKIHFHKFDPAKSESSTHIELECKCGFTSVVEKDLVKAAMDTECNLVRGTFQPLEGRKE
jgi:hypothetical protein